MSDLTDEELPGYALIHCETPVAAFHRKHVARLLRLAGEHNNADIVENSAKEWWHLGPDRIRPIVRKIAGFETE